MRAEQYNHVLDTYLLPAGRTTAPSVLHKEVTRANLLGFLAIKAKEFCAWESLYLVQ